MPEEESKSLSDGAFSSFLIWFFSVSPKLKGSPCRGFLKAFKAGSMGSDKISQQKKIFGKIPTGKGFFPGYEQNLGIGKRLLLNFKTTPRVYWALHRCDAVALSAVYLYLYLVKLKFTLEMQSLARKGKLRLNLGLNVFAEGFNLALVSGETREEF